jgi:transposase
MTLANILRVDAHLHRRVPADSELCQAIAVLARAHQDAIWRRTTAHHQLRSLLREFYPTFLAVFTSRFTLGIASPEAPAVLAIAPTPAAAAKLPTAMAKNALALLAALNTACVNVDELRQASAQLFHQHPDYAIITSFPGPADSTGARLLAEIGDDRSRFADARALKVYAGSAPITRASGRSISITHRHIKNNRLANVGWMWAFTAATNCEPASGGNTATVMPPPPAICSTNSSASCTTASNTTRHSTRQGLSDTAVLRGLATLQSRTLTTLDRVAK